MEGTQDEKKELLKREEIVTMKKDVSSLREAEALQEKQRVMSLNPETGAKPFPQKEQPKAAPFETRKEPVPPAPKKEFPPQEPKREFVPQPPRRDFPPQEPKRDFTPQPPKFVSQEPRKEYAAPEPRKEYVPPEPRKEVFPSEPKKETFVPQPPRPAPLPEKKTIEEEIEKQTGLAPKKPGLKKPELKKINLKEFFSKKTVVRVSFVLIFLIFISGIFYFISKQKKEPEQQAQENTLTPTSTEETATTTATTTEKVILPEIVVQESLVSWGYRTLKTARNIDTIIIHSPYASTSEGYSFDAIINGYKKYRVANHYLIDQNGAVFLLVPEKSVAYHAGTGQMPDGTRKNVINYYSIGIEVLYNQLETPSELQYQVLASLIKQLQQKYSIPEANILGNSQISPERKQDPFNFDWAKLKELLQ